MKSITKPYWWIEKPMMSDIQLAEFCQRMYDNDNWRGLKEDERKKFEIAKKVYKERTGNDVKLIYNCPA